MMIDLHGITPLQKRHNDSIDYSYNIIENNSGDIDSGAGDINDDDSLESIDRAGKRRKLSDEERLKRCRERNKLHARNTREKKKVQIDALHKRIEQLTDEKMKLINEKSEKSVADILMALSGTGASSNPDDIDTFSAKINDGSISSAREETMKILGKIRSQVSSLLVEESDIDKEASPKLPKDRSLCSAFDLEKLRRERNRMHAKKTRLRKKKMLAEMERIASAIETDIRLLREERETATMLSLSSIVSSEVKSEN
jgi:hypothetical protein